MKVGIVAPLLVVPTESTSKHTLPEQAAG